MSTIEERLLVLENQVAAIREQLKPVEPVGDALLAKFASDTVRKTPKQWTGESFEGKRFDALSHDEATALAAYHRWCAKKGAEETPVRVGTNGKPYHERDGLLARVLDAFAAKARARGGFDEF